jgi:hypothetical protein
MNNKLIFTLLLSFMSLIIAMTSFDVLAHGVDDKTRHFLENLLTNNPGVHIVPFIYIGAKHMVTGYDHLLFLMGVLFFVHRRQDVLIYVSLFTLGHCITLMSGVLANISLNAYLIDAIIGFSVLYKGFDNLGGFKRCFNFQPNPKIAVLIFGLFHGFGLATKIQEFGLPNNGLVSNLIAFNVGVELGQLLALMVILIVINAWRRHSSFTRFSNITNTLLMSAGIMLIGLQLTGYFVN